MSSAHGKDQPIPLLPFAVALYNLLKTASSWATWPKISGGRWTACLELPPGFPGEGWCRCGLEKRNESWQGAGEGLDFPVSHLGTFAGPW